MEDTKQPGLSDEEMRKLLKPNVTNEQALVILKATYATDNDDCKVVRQLDSYDDCNFKVEINSTPYLLKFHNGVESRDCLKHFDENDWRKNPASVIHFQNAIIETLLRHDIPTSDPVQPVNNSNNDSSKRLPVSIHSCAVVSAPHSPEPLVVRLFAWVIGQPMSEVSLLPLESLADAGRFLGRMDTALDTMTTNSLTALNHHLRHSGSSSHDVRRAVATVTTYPAAQRYHQWDGKNLADLRHFVPYIVNDKRRALVESVLQHFQSELMDTKVYEQFRIGINHGDFNDANILVDADLNVSGVIDFGDSIESWRVLEISIAMAYSMLSSYGKTNRSISSAAAMLRGYNSVYPLTDVERKHLILLMACRLACSCTLGAYSYQQNPANEYLLLHAEPAWKALELIWGYSDEIRASRTAAFNRVFQQACLYTDSSQKIITTYDLDLPDPNVADLLASVRVASIYDDRNHGKPAKKRKLSSKGNCITFVTGNFKKLEEVRRILGMNSSKSTLPFQLTNKKIDLPELQGEALNIAREKSIEAAKLVNGAVLVEDTSLCFNCLNGMPGVFIKWFLDSCGLEGLNRMISDYENKSAYAQTVVAFCPGPNQDPVLFDGRTTGKIVMPRGDEDFGWDPIFEPDEGKGKTYAEMTKEEKDAISHRTRAFQQTRDYLIKFKEDIQKQIQ